MIQIELKTEAFNVALLKRELSTMKAKIEAMQQSLDQMPCASDTKRSQEHGASDLQSAYV